MKKMIDKVFLVVVDVAWIILFIAVVSSSVFLTSSTYSFAMLAVNKWIALGLSIFLFINIYIIMCGLLFRVCVPRLKPGRAKIGLSKQYVIFRLNWHFYSLIFLFFKKYVFYNRTIRYIFLRLLRVNIKYSTYFAETVDLQDANNLLTIGKNSGLGSEVLIATHLALSTEVIIFKPVTIGDNSHIQARASIAPGVKIGNNSIIGFDTALSINVCIGDNTKIGGRTIVNSGAKIGSNCRIGDNVFIGERVIIHDNAIVPNCAIVLKAEDLEMKKVECGMANPGA